MPRKTEPGRSPATSGGACPTKGRLNSGSSGDGGGSLRADVPVVTEAEDEVADSGEQEEQDHTPDGALTEGLGNIDGHQDSDDDVDERNQVEQAPPGGTSGDLHQDEEIVNGNK